MKAKRYDVPVFFHARYSAVEYVVVAGVVAKTPQDLVARAHAGRGIMADPAYRALAEIRSAAPPRQREEHRKGARQ